jgi:hypothetical protein
VTGPERLSTSDQDAWGDVDLLTEAAVLKLLQRLDQEEGDTGVEPW